jgi:hypothetical protein
VTQEVLSGVSDAAAYYQGIEEYFVARRGDPLFLSNADWTLIRKWRVAGVPLRIVLRGIHDALDGHAHSWGRKRKVGSLAYCAAEVEAARERWHRALALGLEGTSAAEALRGFAESLEKAPLGPRGRACALGAAPLLEDWAAQGEDVRALEPRLQALEAKLVQALRDDLGVEKSAALEAEIEADLAPYRARMPEKVLAQVRTGSLSRRVLESCALPRLSLFHL